MRVSRESTRVRPRPIHVLYEQLIGFSSSSPKAHRSYPFHAHLIACLTASFRSCELVMQPNPRLHGLDGKQSQMPLSRQRTLPSVQAATSSPLAAPSGGPVPLEA
jgi:hypothetical protein